MEKKRMRQIHDRGAHNYKQIRDPDLQMDLQSNIQDDPPLDPQADLQKDLQTDLQANLQVRTDLQPDLWVQTGLEGTLQQKSPLVSFWFPLQAETSTGREKPMIWMRNNPSLMLPGQCTSMGGTCEWRKAFTRLQDAFTRPQTCVIGELPIKSLARRKFGSAHSNLQVYKDLQEPTQIYKTHHITGHTPIHLESEQHKRNSVHYIPSDACNNIQAMLSHPEHPALPMGNLVTPSFYEKGTIPCEANHC